MAAKIKYTCLKCGATKEVSEDRIKTPECCSRPMRKDEPLDVCESSFGAEDTRMDDLGGPCDDGRSG